MSTRLQFHIKARAHQSSAPPPEVIRSNRCLLVTHPAHTSSRSVRRQAVLWHMGGGILSLLSVVPQSSENVPQSSQIVRFHCRLLDLPCRFGEGSSFFRNRALGNREVCKPLLLSASPRCIISGMASGSIVLFYNDFNRWHHEYQTRYWRWQLRGSLAPSLGVGGVVIGSIFLLEIVITSECNLNLL